MRVLNKVDVASPETVAVLRRVYPDALQASALSGAGVTELRNALAMNLQALAGRITVGLS